MRDAAASLEFRWIIEGFDKLIVPAAATSPAADKSAGGSLELYDLKADPREEHNLADDPAQRAKIERLTLRLNQWWP
jgi:hypothetical protein